MEGCRFAVLFLLLVSGVGGVGAAASEPSLSEQARRTTSLNWPEIPRLSLPPRDKLSAERPAVTEASRPFRVFIDAGHGGHDFGAPGQAGVSEKNLCLKVVSKVRRHLAFLAAQEGLELESRLSRDGDFFVPLRERARVANQWPADLFISIHANSSPAARASGFEVYFLSNEATDADASRLARKENGENALQALSRGVRSILSDLRTNTHIIESSLFAEAVYSALSDRIKPNGKGVRQAPFAVLSGTEMPALLIELGYLTNPREAQLLVQNAYQEKLASGIARGVLDFALKSRRVMPAVPSPPAAVSAPAKSSTI